MVGTFTSSFLKWRFINVNSSYFRYALKEVHKRYEYAEIIMKFEYITLWTIRSTYDFSVYLLSHIFWKYLIPKFAGYTRALMRLDQKQLIDIECDFVKKQKEQ